MQTMYALAFGETFRRDMPPPDAVLTSGIAWGRFDELFTAAYWCGQAWQAGLLGLYGSVNLGRTLAEETAACLLGGLWHARRDGARGIRSLAVARIIGASKSCART